MPRSARKQSDTGIYHIVLRGINKQTIFEDKDDYTYFLDALAVYKDKCGYSILAYCLMGNHVHLLMKEGAENLGVVFKRIAGRFVYWYNNKYRRIGHLFQDRFISEPVQDEAYLLTVLRYIHQNPLKAKLSKSCDYPYSSYSEYIGKRENALVDSSYIFGIINEAQFKKFHEELSGDECIDMAERNERKNYITDAEATEIICRECACQTPMGIQTLDIKSRNLMLGELKRRGLSIRQLSRLTGVSTTIVARA